MSPFPILHIAAGSLAILAGGGCDLGSPLLFIPAFAPLVSMIFWLVRVRFMRWYSLVQP